MLVGLALIWHEPFPSSRDLLWGALAGVAGGLGLLSFYSALSRGQMGIAAPVSAMLTATIPVLFSTFTAGLPNLIQVAGFILALLAIGLISGSRQANRPSKGIGLALLAGCGFGCFFVLISRVSPGATFWPLAMARLTSVLLLFVVTVT